MNKESNVSKFQVGDRVIRIGNSWGGLLVGGEYTVSSVDGSWLGLAGQDTGTSDPEPYDEHRFELVTPIPQALTPKEVLQAVVDDVPLQVHSSYSGWVNVVHPERICLKDVDGWKYRIKPNTVSINDTEVVKPKLDNAVKYSQKYYTFAEGLQTVVEVRPAFVADCKLYWDTREAAWAALKVITAVLRGE